MSLRLTTLGSPRVFRDATEVGELPSQRLRFALLAYLAVETEAPRETILSLFWPDRDAGRARHALRQMLYELRQLLGEEWIEQGRDRITVRAEVDAVAFERAAAEGRTTEALALYGGPFLDGFSLDNRGFEGWVDRRRAQLGRVHRRLRRERIEELLSSGDAAAARRIAQEWVELDPLEDEASHALIRCMALTGERLAALQYYESYERQLAGELQVEPLEETRELVEQIRSGEFGPGSPPAAAPPPVAAPTPAAPPTDPAVDTAPAGRLPAGGAAPVERRAIPEPPRATTPWRSRAFMIAAGLAVVLLAGALAYRSERPRPQHATPGARVIVLPFSDRTEDSSLVSLAGALTETLARNLAQSRPLDVVSPAGVALLRERGVPDDSVGRMMQADYLVSGSISAGKDWVRVGVDLLDGRTGSLVRSEVIERAPTESRILVEDVVERTAVILRREVGHQVEVQRVRASTSNEEAWRNVLEARALQEPLARLIRYRDFEAFERALTRADSLLARAGELDRRWAEPLVLRGWLMERRAFVATFASSDSASRRKQLEAARSMAERAIERDRNEPRAYELRGAVLHQLALLPNVPRDTVRQRLAAAEEELQRATYLDPNGAAAWRRLAEVLNSAGRYAAAKSAAERAYRIDRYVAEANSIINLLFSTSLELGEDGEAERWCREGRRSFPGQAPFVYCLFALHAWAERVPPDVGLLETELRSYRNTESFVQPELMTRLETLLAVAHARAGRPDSARALLLRAQVPNPDPGLLWLRAGAFGSLGDYGAAMPLLASYVSRGSWESYRVAQTRPFWRFRGRADYERLIGT